MTKISIQDLFVLYATGKINREDLKTGIMQVNHSLYLNILQEIEKFVNDICFRKVDGELFGDQAKFEKLDKCIDDLTEIFVEILENNKKLYN